MEKSRLNKYEEKEKGERKKNCAIAKTIKRAGARKKRDKLEKMKSRGANY